MSRKKHQNKENFWISPNFRAEDWWRLTLDDKDGSSWYRAVDIFLDRIRGRFLIPVEVIENHPDDNVSWFSGFAILALDCLIIETLHQFYNGLNETTGEHKQAFWNFFHASVHFNEFTEDTAHIFYSHFRCGILHQAQTKKQSKVRFAEDRMVQLVNQNNLQAGLIIDRKMFHKALCKEIEDYATRLRNPSSPHDYELRVKFKDKMRFIAG